MSIYSLLKVSPNNISYYRTRDKLLEYVEERVLAKIEAARRNRDMLDTQQKHKAYVEEMRQKFIENLGVLPYEKNRPLNTKVTGTVTEDDLTIENIIFESRENVFVTANVYLPKNREKQSAAVLFFMGHSVPGKVAQHYQKVARRIARQGFIVLAVDPTGQGERLNYVEKGEARPLVEGATVDHSYFGYQCILTGDSPTGYFIADGMRAVDYLESRDDVDSERIAVTGASGGGTMTCHMMICDERVKAAAPSVFVTSRDVYMKASQPQDAEQIWLNSLNYGFDFEDICVCFAPKPCMILAAEYDFFHIEGTEKTVERTRRIWEMYNSEELHLTVDNVRHSYSEAMAENCANFFGRIFGVDYKNNINNKAVFDEKKLWCTKSGQVVLDNENALNMYQENSNRAQKLFGINKEKARQFLIEKMNFERQPIRLHMRYYANEICENGLKYIPMMWFVQERLPNTGMLVTHYKTRTPEKITVLLTERGCLDLERTIYRIRKIIKDGGAVFIPELSSMGRNEIDGQLAEGFLGSGAKGGGGYMYSINMNMLLMGDSLCALRLFEIDTMLRMLREYFTDDISIYAEGRMANIAGLYHIVDESVAMELSEHDSYRDIVFNKYYENYNIYEIILPGIIKYLDKDSDI